MDLKIIKDYSVIELKLKVLELLMRQMTFIMWVVNMLGTGEYIYCEESSSEYDIKL